MSEYVVQQAVDSATGQRLIHSELLFVRRIEPPLPIVYTMLCRPDGHGHRVHSLFADGAQRSIHSGPISVDPRFVYLAVFIPEVASSSQSEVVSQLLTWTQPTYRVQPDSEDVGRHRLRASRWGTRPALRDEDARVIRVLEDLGFSSRAVTAYRNGSPAQRRQALDQLLDTLSRVAVRELSQVPQPIVSGPSQEEDMRERLRGLPGYGEADGRERAEIIRGIQQILIEAHDAQD